MTDLESAEPRGFDVDLDRALSSIGNRLTAALWDAEVNRQRAERAESAVDALSLRIAALEDAAAKGDDG